ncbi:MAG: SWIM zinc finger family protein [Nitrososphaeraceae archaeon]
MKNYPLSSRCARQLLKMPRRLVNREELGRLIAQTSGVIIMIDESNYKVRSTSGNNTYNVNVTESGWVCSCLDYARHNAKCKHVYAVEFFRY